MEIVKAKDSFRTTFRNELNKQRWDDHRLYHHSRVNQSLHLLSALSFLCTYVLLFVNSLFAVFIGWFIAMWLRQVGHFFFEPKGFDEVNGMSHAEKESVKVGYNLRRKIVLLTIWAASPIVLYYQPSLFGLFEPDPTLGGFLQQLSAMWLVLGIGAVAFRTIQLFFVEDVQTGLVWCTKILTDPIHDLKMYYNAPLHLARGELIDPMDHVRH